MGANDDVRQSASTSPIRFAETTATAAAISASSIPRPIDTTKHATGFVTTQYAWECGCDCQRWWKQHATHRFTTHASSILTSAHG